MELMPISGPHADDATSAFVHDRGLDVGPRDEFGSERLGMPGKHLVELGAPAHHAEVRVVGQLRPWKDEGGHGSTVNTQPLGVLPPSFLADVNAQSDELADGTRCQPVTTDLVTGKGGLLQEHDVQPLAGKIRSSGRSARSSTHDEGVGAHPTATHVRHGNLLVTRP